MASLSTIVKQILDQCGKKRIQPPVTDALAVFVVRMIIYDNPDKFNLERTISDVDVRALVDGAVGFLCQENSPQLETVKMQAAFDTAYYSTQQKLEDGLEGRNSKLAEYQRAILAAGPKSAEDFDLRTALYRQIFSFVMTHAGAQGPPDADVQREVAAALESVFPRVGLKAFVALPPDDKSSQLKELSHLILGIRVFNWDIGKGGAGITDIPKQINDTLGDLERRLQVQVDNAGEVCDQYVDVLVAPAAAVGAAPDDSDAATARNRWKDELANRRQLAAFLNTIAEDVREDKAQFEAALSSFRAELEDVKRLVAGRSSVPKEQVYPKFHSMATHWLTLQDVRDRVVSRKSVHSAIAPFVPPSVCTLHLDTVRKVRAYRVPHSGKAGGDGKVVEEESSSLELPEGVPPSEEPPLRLSLEASPDFMQLPLEFQGYCSHAIVNRGGLLLPGDPSLGVVRFQGRYFVFSSEKAVQDFMANPVRYTQGVITAAKRSPELVHLLQLQSYFPQASMAGIVRALPSGGLSSGAPGAPRPSLEDSLKSLGSTLSEARGVAELGVAAPKTRDASTETPTHFVERHIDPRYHWNEWDMRRKMLRYADIKNSRTVSVQSHISYFRRENDTQVYLPKESTTQTGISTGTNPVRVVRYIEGLRGRAPVVSSEAGPTEPSVRVASYTIDTA